jgi:hypothetical protein
MPLPTWPSGSDWHAATTAKEHAIQDNASYHKDGEVWAWFGENRHWLEVY